MFRLSLWIAGIVLCAAGQALAANFSGLGIGGGYTGSMANDVSGDGSVVVGSRTGPISLISKGFRWTAATGIVDLPLLDAQTPLSAARAISDDGRWIGGNNSARAYRWHDGSLDTSLGWYGPPPTLNAGATTHGVSADGSVLVGSSKTNFTDQTAFRWTASEGMTSLGALGGTTLAAVANDVSADGKVVVGESSSNTGQQAFVWSAPDGMRGLGALSGDNSSSAIAVSADGATVIGNSYGANNRQRAFRWTAAGGMEDLHFGGLSSGATDLTPNGSMIVGFADQEAIVWDSVHGARTLREMLSQAGVAVGGWTQLDARGVSTDGMVVVGTGTNPAGQVEAWRATLPPMNVPEPGGVILLSAITMLVGVRRGR
jgi:probable HAF family extracellular repeat protein